MKVATGSHGLRSRAATAAGGLDRNLLWRFSSWHRTTGRADEKTKVVEAAMADASIDKEQFYVKMYYTDWCIRQYSKLGIHTYDAGLKGAPTTCRVHVRRLTKNIVARNSG